MEKIHPLLDKDKQKQAQRYERENRLLGLAGALLSLFILLGFYSSELSALLASLSLGSSMIWTFIAYVAVFQAVLVMFSFPLNLYSSYFHEHKWNFSNQTFKGWLWEQAKSFFVSFIILLLILGLLLWIMALFLENWWLVAGLAMALVSVMFAALFPIVILPIFNKYTPIQNNELTEELEKILSKEGLKSSGFFKEDMSKQTKKENAFLAGLGKTRRVVLGDNLLENMTIAEIKSIIAHEVGHYKHKHILKNVFVGTVQQLVVFYILNLAMKSIFPQFLSSTQWNLTLFPIFAILMVAISSVFLRPLSYTLSRFLEKQADLYSLKNTKDKKAFMTALAGLADRNLSNAYPDWWVKVMYHSHPPIGERLHLAERFVQGLSDS